MSLRHRPEFVEAWGSVYRRVYRWRREGRFSVVPSLLRAPVRSYLPGLHYSDLEPGEALALSRELGGRRFDIRALGEPCPEESLSPGAPVVSRLDLAAFGHDLDAVWKRGLRHRARTAVRRSRRRYEVAEESGPGGFAALREMLALAFGRHGSPLPPAALFDSLRAALDGRIPVVRDRRSGEVAAAALWLRDGPLAWAPWGGARRSPDLPGHRLYWALVEKAAAEGVEVLDFGRSPFGSGSWRLKRNFGAVAVPLLRLSDRPRNLYRRYGAAQRIWRRLPRALTDRAAPTLCRYLADY